jgi:ATPase subunit of ABC transporter with duplicated ATPase domains
MPRLSRRQRSLGFEFPPRAGRTVAEADGLDIRIERQPLAQASSAGSSVESTSRCRPNGSGKTTLLETTPGRGHVYRASRLQCRAYCTSPAELELTHAAPCCSACNR